MICQIPFQLRGIRFLSKRMVVTMHTLPQADVSTSRSFFLKGQGSPKVKTIKIPSSAEMGQVSTWESWRPKQLWIFWWHSGLPGLAWGYDRTLTKQKRESFSHFLKYHSQPPKVSLLHRKLWRTKPDWQRIQNIKLYALGTLRALGFEP